MLEDLLDLGLLNDAVEDLEHSNSVPDLRILSHELHLLGVQVLTRESI